MEKLKSYNFWVKLISALVLVGRVVLNDLGYMFDSDLVMDITTAIAGMLVICGIIQAPVTTKKTKKENNMENNGLEGAELELENLLTNFSSRYPKSGGLGSIILQVAEKLGLIDSGSNAENDLGAQGESAGKNAESSQAKGGESAANDATQVVEETGENAETAKNIAKNAKNEVNITTNASKNVIAAQTAEKDNAENLGANEALSSETAETTLGAQAETLGAQADVATLGDEEIFEEVTEGVGVPVNGGIASQAEKVLASDAQVANCQKSLEANTMQTEAIAIKAEPLDEKVGALFAKAETTEAASGAPASASAEQGALDNLAGAQTDDKNNLADSDAQIEGENNLAGGGASSGDKNNLEEDRINEKAVAVDMVTGEFIQNLQAGGDVVVEPNLQAKIKAFLLENIDKIF